MSRTWLILDCNYLCHRAKHSTGGLSYGGKPTGVIYGFLKSLTVFQEIFHSNRFVFCWDSKTNIRKKLFSQYKANRIQKQDTRSKDEIAFDVEFRNQMKKLRITYLPKIGFRNVFVQPGRESDDIIASVVRHLPIDEDAVIISADQDLFQLISPFVSIFNPRTGKQLTLQGFKKKYGIVPMNWGNVKAYAGCTSDGVPGIRGVGEKTAIKFLRRELKIGSKAIKAITSKQGVRIAKRNAKLVVLPFKGTKIFELRKNKLSGKGWRMVCKQLGMASLKERMPFGKRRRK